ncbi:MAG: imidazole glycerol phosphate synthase subunit HisH [Dehalococcoidia bacterium]|nr:imidazole glycerol phosphate synthase subunit HisH [Dehalococcoidia bacterium]MDD5493450.1 imidazole glycerol phosphate synthase subunit HisH [Dehalococcoidia bacterium]
MIAVINYGSGNLGSVANALVKLGRKPSVTSSISDVLKADAVFLPGVGAAGDTMKGLQALGMDKALKKLFELGRPVFAICVGLQVLLTATEEGGEHICLDVIPGRVRKLPGGLKVPHMGWNQVHQLKSHPVFNGIPDNSNFYFVHSYYVNPEDKSTVAAITQYGIELCSMVIIDNLIATQFHPEKSGELGLKMYSNFLDLANC